MSLALHTFCITVLCEFVLSLKILITFSGQKKGSNNQKTKFAKIILVKLACYHLRSLWLHDGQLRLEPRAMRAKRGPWNSLNFGPLCILIQRCKPQVLLFHLSTVLKKKGSKKKKNKEKTKTKKNVFRAKCHDFFWILKWSPKKKQRSALFNELVFQCNLDGPPKVHGPRGHCPPRPPSRRPCLELH